MKSIAQIKNAGITIQDITSLMKKYERIIAFYNKKYAYEVESKGAAKEIAEYRKALKAWDDLKPVRDRLKM